MCIKLLLAIDGRAIFVMCRAYQYTLPSSRYKMSIQSIRAGSK